MADCTDCVHGKLEDYGLWTPFFEDKKIVCMFVRLADKIYIVEEEER